MFLEASAAKTLFAIVIATNQGAERLNSQLPLHVADRGDSWLVTGTPYTDERLQTQYNMCHMFILKRTAEIVGINCHGRMVLSKQEDHYWSNFMTPEQYAAVFGPPSDFRPTGILDIWFALYGGIVNTPVAAAEYAAVLMRTKPTWANVTSTDLKATERDKVWRVTSARYGTGDLLTISRETGEVLSGDL